MDHFNAGDKMYVVNNQVQGKQINNVIICRLIKPLTLNEIDTMQVDDHEKAVLRLKADNPKLKPYMIFTHDYVVADAKNGDVGTYIDHVVFRTISIDNKYVWQHYYAFEPNTKGVRLNNYDRKLKIPEGYVLANDTYYLFPLFVKNSKQ